jgi:hypothetical protein
MLVGIGCTTGLPKIPVVQVGENVKKGMLVTLLKNDSGSYTISVLAVQIPNESKAEIKKVLGIEEVGMFVMIYDAKTESFFLMPPNVSPNGSILNDRTFNVLSKSNE